jgi:hypothetical protein
VRALALAAALASAAAAPLAAQERRVLVSCAFEEGESDTGADTLRVFAHARGRVAPSREVRLSGGSALEIVDVPGDGDFPELQGTFPRVSSGTLHARFGFLTASPHETWNVALAGPAWFANAKDGIAFRLEAKDGVLVHHSDSIPKKLFPLDAWRWYVVELVYRVEPGTYDLRIREDGKNEPLVALVDQPNGSASPGSAVEVFSFAGDVEEDASEADLFVDDLRIWVDREVDAPQTGAGPAAKR